MRGRRPQVGPHRSLSGFKEVLGLGLGLRLCSGVEACTRLTYSSDPDDLHGTSVIAAIFIEPVEHEMMYVCGGSVADALERRDILGDGMSGMSQDYGQRNESRT